jgi:hypothetical protein
MSETGLNRRQALRKLAVGGLGTATTPLWIENLRAVAQAHAEHAHARAVVAAPLDWKPKVLSGQQNETVITLTELIIPTTDTPGGKAALVNRFVDEILSDSGASERREFQRGLQWIDQRSRELFGADFVGATPEEQNALLTIVSSAKNTQAADQIGTEFFQAMKSMTITGYYTSEIGMRQELGDDGQVFFAEFKGCTHPEHGAPPPARTSDIPKKKSG